MSTYQFWQLAIERAVKTFTQSLLAIFIATGVGLLTVSWSAALPTAGIAAVLSVLMSMAATPVSEPSSPSLLPVGPRPRPRCPGHPARRPHPPSQAAARLSPEGSHRGRTYRPEPALLRKTTEQQVADQVRRGRWLVVDGGRNDRRTAPLHTGFLRDASHRPSRTPTGS